MPYVRIALAVAFASAAAGPLFAGTVLPNLPPGSQYQLVFVSAGTRDAISSDIADYDVFVTQQAALNSDLPSGVAWNALASTGAVDAINHAPTWENLPIYNTHGELVANGTSDLWDGAISNRVGYDQFGNSSLTLVYTGSLASGYRSVPGHLASGNVILGASSSASDGWMNAGITLSSDSPSQFYALSSPITVVPEPSSLALVGIGVAVLLGRAWRKRWR